MRNKIKAFLVLRADVSMPFGASELQQDSPAWGSPSGRTFPSRGLQRPGTARGNAAARRCLFKGALRMRSCGKPRSARAQAQPPLLMKRKNQNR